jgi:KinB signaling pathway activation protein
MTLKKLVFWIISTLLLGTIFGVVLGWLIGGIAGVSLGVWTQLLLTGATFAAVAELGFFSYLVFNWLARGFFNSQKMFVGVQVALIVVLMINLIYLNTSKFSGVLLGVHLLVPLLLLVVSLLIAWWKMKKDGNRQVFIPTLFFMVAATTLESIPSLNSKAGELPLPFVLFTVLLLLVCNSYQILQLRWLVTRSDKKEKTPSKT